MTEQETYDRPRDTAPPAAPLPSEPYYQGPPARRGRVGLGLALVVVGVLLLAAQLLGGVGFGGGGILDRRRRDHSKSAGFLRGGGKRS